MRRSVLHRFCIAMVLVCPGTTLAAQQGAERASIDSLFSELAALAPTDPIPPDTRCAAYTGTLGRFCRNILEVRRVERAPEDGTAFNVEMAMRRVVDEKPDWATGWYVLAIARLQLTRARVLAREGPRQPMGVSAEAGAGLALVTALTLEPTFLTAAEALAMAPIPREGASQLGERRDALRHLRGTLPLSPAARMGVAIVERESGDPDTAVVMLREAIAAGADSGIVHLELARMYHKANKAMEGRAALIAGASMTASARANARYREELSWLASPAELQEWDSLPVPARTEWLDAFWTAREVRDGRVQGERMIEHYRRYETAMKEFLIRVPQKGRQRVRSVALAGDAMVLDGGTATGAASRQGSSAGGSIEEEERARTGVQEYAETIGGNAPFREFGITQEVMDDRGVIWIRHGKPTERSYTSGGTAIEGWRYARAPEADLVLFFAEADFDGQSGASVLIPTPVTAGGLAINQICGGASGMCDELLRFGQPEGVMNRGGNAMRGRLGALPTAERAAPSQNVINDSREQGRTRIVQGVTTDDHRRTFDQLLEPTVQIYGLDRANGGASRLLVSFAIPGEKLLGTQPPAAGGRTVYPIRIQLMTTARGSARRFDIDTMRNFASARPLVAGQFLTGTLELPVPPGTYAATVVLSQEGGRGALSRITAVSAPVNGSRLSISSLVLGREGSGAAWNSGGRVVPLHPLNAFTRAQQAELYYQLNGVQPGQQYQTRVELFPTAAAGASAALGLSFTDEPTDRFVETQRSIGLNNLEPGRYRLRVTVSGAGSSVSEEGYLTVVKGEG
jgi:hypothetical protein